MRTYHFTYPDGTEDSLDKALLETQKVPEDRIDLLIHANIYKWKLYKQMEEEADDPMCLMVLAKKIEELDFYIQELWGFEKNPDYHRWWEIPCCNCGVLGAEDHFGTSIRIYSTECPIHSWKQFE